MNLFLANHEPAITHLPLAIVLVSFAGAAAAPLAGWFSAKLRDWFIIFLTALICLLSFFLLQAAWPQALVKSYQIGFGNVPLLFKVDRLGALFNFLSAFIWFLASLFSLSYMTHERRTNRYYFFYLLTLGGCLGVFLTGDLFSLFCFFELMSLASYMLVIHTQTTESLSAGRLYLFLGVFGGLCILSATIVLYALTGSVLLTPSLEALIRLPLNLILALLFITGFGIKAGMVPLHIWLPKAHPVAPSPASALLSGIMIKTGAYGILRVVGVLFTPADLKAQELWGYTASFGYVIIWFGIVTMLMAAVIALFQTNTKTILAYSSVSQMGYILTGIGACAYLGQSGALAMGGFTLHVLNHAFFKAGLFMMIGAVYHRTGELDLKKLGGLWREFPVTTVVFLLAALGLAGIPGLNGYTSKVLLHHALTEAYEHHHLYSLFVAERLFMLTGVLTTCYIARLFSTVFLGQKPAGLKVQGQEPWNERVVFILLGLIILFVGLKPLTVLRAVVAPVVQIFAFNELSIKYLANVNFWGGRDLLGVVGVVFLAALLFYAGFRFKIFETRLPRFLSVEDLIYRPLVNFLQLAFTRSGRLLEAAVDGGFIESTRLLIPFCRMGAVLDAAADSLFVQTLQPLKVFSYQVGSLEQKLAPLNKFVLNLPLLLNAVYRVWLALLSLIFTVAKKLFMGIFNFLFRLDYRHEGRFYRVFNTENFEYYLLVFFITLLIFMSLRFLR